ncbi:MAG: S26 family signal peptidase, partial [Bacteroidales bacterium]|nr:S26 family signal peptidase [Bacteroidales bacterium]
LLFSLWTQSAWWLLAIPFFLDVYITRFIPWGFWKTSKNATFRSIMDWADAIVFALAAVYVINLYFFQNYQIPSSSLEKSLLVGDFLFVSKVHYGPRVPNTPIAFPLAQHTIPFLNVKSYLDKPHWDYKRVRGLDTIKHNDIVVFNFPAGDTVPVNMSNPDYYTLSYYLATNHGISVEQAGSYIRTHPETYGKVVYRPVDRRENYVKRCIGLPGDSLQIIQNQVYINGQKLEDRPGVQYNYLVQTKGGYFGEKQLKDWGISKEDQTLLPPDHFYSHYLPFRTPTSSNPAPIYHLPLTHEMFLKMQQNPMVDTIMIEPDVVGNFNTGGPTYPLNDSIQWTRDNYGPIWIPRKGSSIELNEHNLALYERVIRNYEQNEVALLDGLVYINGALATQYTFKMDYYWMMGDNRHNSADSRAWGFVPEDHVVGKPLRVWLSLDKDKGWFNGKIRWKRFFKKAD